MAFVFHQLCQKENLNEMKLFKISLEFFSEGGVCLLSDPEKKTFCFVCGIFNPTTYVDFTNTVNPGAVQSFVKGQYHQKLQK